MAQASKREIKEALDDRDWWQSFGRPLGWRLFGWTYRHAASFYDENDRTVEMTAAHVRLINAHRADAGGGPVP